MRVAHDDPMAARRIAGALRRRFASPPNIVCIGSDRSTGDALGPMVGSILETWGIRVYGTLDAPVHASNLQNYLPRIKGPTLAVDACLGRLESVGAVEIGSGPLKPGAGVNKSLPSVGTAYLTGTVTTGGFMEVFALQNTRLGLVVRMANVIAAGIAEAFGAAEQVAAGSIPAVGRAGSC